MKFSEISFPKEDARILWNTNENGKITEIEIIRFPINDIKNWPVHMHKLYSFDIGNAENTWNDYTFGILMIKFFYEYGFAHKNIAEKFIKDLRKIEEFRHEIQFIIYQLCLLNEEE